MSFVIKGFKEDKLPEVEIIISASSEEKAWEEAIEILKEYKKIEVRKIC